MKPATRRHGGRQGGSIVDQRDKVSGHGHGLRRRRAEPEPFFVFGEGKRGGDHETTPVDMANRGNSGGAVVCRDLHCVAFCGCGARFRAGQ